jgi:hypothetical protein
METLRMDGAVKEWELYLPLFVVDQGFHMHVSDICVVGVVVCQGPIVSGKKSQG